MRIASTVILGLVALILIGSIFISVISDVGGLVEALLGAFLGTLAGASVMYVRQLEMEQTRFFHVLLQEIREVFSSSTAWKSCEGGWRRCEFRKAVGTARWTNDPSGEDGYAHKSLEVDLDSPRYSTIDWEGIVYSVDPSFCVASKALHDYANWYNLLLDARQNGLLARKHVKMLWRSLGDGLFSLDPAQAAKTPGMRNWLEFFALGRSSTESRGTATASQKQHVKLLQLLERFPPVAAHFENRRHELRGGPGAGEGPNLAEER